MSPTTIDRAGILARWAAQAAAHKRTRLRSSYVAATRAHRAEQLARSREREASAVALRATGMTQRAIADTIGVSQQSVSEYLSAKHVVAAPRATLAQRLAARRQAAAT